MNLTQYHEYCFGVRCRFCKAKTLDPDKVKGQKWLNATCATCGQNPNVTNYRYANVKAKDDSDKDEGTEAIRSWWNFH